MILWVLTAFNKHILNIITKQQSLGRFQKDVLSISDRSLCRLTLIWKFGFDWRPFVVKRINNNFWNAHKLNLPFRLAVKASGNPIIFYAKIKYLRLESIFNVKIPQRKEGVLLGVLGGWVPLVLQILAKKCHFPNPFSDQTSKTHTRFQNGPLGRNCVYIIT